MAIYCPLAMCRRCASGAGTEYRDARRAFIAKLPAMQLTTAGFLVTARDAVGEPTVAALSPEAHVAATATPAATRARDAANPYRQPLPGHLPREDVVHDGP